MTAKQNQADQDVSDDSFEELESMLTEQASPERNNLEVEFCDDDEKPP